MNQDDSIAQIGRSDLPGHEQCAAKRRLARAAVLPDHSADGEGRAEKFDERLSRLSRFDGGRRRARDRKSGRTVDHSHQPHIDRSGLYRPGRNERLSAAAWPHPGSGFPENRKRANSFSGSVVGFRSDYARQNTTRGIAAAESAPELGAGVAVAKMRGLHRIRHQVQFSRRCPYRRVSSV